MLAEEQKIKIIELLSHQNTISVNEIGKVLNATSVTIRKDLSELESEGKLQRIHGGAIWSRRLRPENRRPWPWSPEGREGPCRSREASAPEWAAGCGRSSR